MATVKSTQRRDLEKDIICSAGWCLAGAHLGGIWEHLGSIWEASGGGIRRHLGSILGSIRKHLGIILGASEYIWKHLEAYGNIWEASGSIYADYKSLPDCKGCVQHGVHQRRPFRGWHCLGRRTCIRMPIAAASIQNGMDGCRSLP